LRCYCQRIIGGHARGNRAKIKSIITYIFTYSTIDVTNESIIDRCSADIIATAIPVIRRDTIDQARIIVSKGGFG
jgi:hypothetical protein